MSGEYPGLRKEVPAKSHGIFILYFTHSEKEHPEHSDQRAMQASVNRL